MLKTNHTAWQPLVQAYTMLDRVEEAIRAFEALDRDPYAVDLTALSAYINALVRAGRMEAALRVLQRSDEAARQAGAARAQDILVLMSCSSGCMPCQQRVLRAMACSAHGEYGEP